MAPRVALAVLLNGRTGLCASSYCFLSSANFATISMPVIAESSDRIGQI
jgi:hypothetical protein